MKPIDKIKTMLYMQKSLNNATCGEGWESGYTNKNRLISWKRCIYMECAELIDSFAWKHWKDLNGKIKRENVAVEVVDIWHFVMSLILETYKNENIGDIEKLSQDLISVKGFNEFVYDCDILREDNMYEVINDIEIIIHECSGFEYNLGDLVANFIRLAMKCELNLQRLYEIYIGKNALNLFRQKHGYKEGTYKKIWDGKEDNEVMSEILKSGILQIDEIYKELEKRYKK